MDEVPDLVGKSFSQRGSGVPKRLPGRAVACGSVLVYMMVFAGEGAAARQSCHHPRMSRVKYAPEPGSQDNSGEKDGAENMGRTVNEREVRCRHAGIDSNYSGNTNSDRVS